MFSLFLTLGRSIWWDFERKEIESVINDSLTKPLFVLLYAPDCPHCHGLPEQFRNYSESYGSRENILVTTIDCNANRRGCSVFPFHSTPTMLLIVGEDENYWPRTKLRWPHEWNDWINSYTDPQFREIRTLEELEKAKEEPADGGATFLLEIRDKNDPVLETMNSLTKAYKIYNDTFVYMIKTELVEPKLTVFRDKFCGREYHGDFSADSLKEFVDDNKFGIHHLYYPDEFTDLISNKRSLIYINNDETLLPQQRTALAELPKGSCSDDVVFGWASVEDRREILNATKKSLIDVPFLYGIDRNRGCEWIYQGKLSEAGERGIVESVVRGVCATKTAKYKVQQTVLWLSVIIGGWIVLFVIPGVLYKRDNQKME